MYFCRRMSRILAIDYGRKRTGIAVTDPMQIIANGLTTVPTHELMDFLLKYVAQLKKKLPDMPVELVDERFTSVLAHQAMLDGGLKKKARQDKALVDEISATIILQSYLESRRM